MACPPHPYGIQPLGQRYLETGAPDARTPGLGRLARLPDEVLLSLLYALPAPDLQRLGACSRALYAYAHYDELWKALALEGLEGGIQSWHGSWRATYLAHTQPRYVVGSHRPLVVRGLYSDLLHQPWRCATMEMEPEWLEVDNVDRVSGLGVADFRLRYEEPNRPVVLTDVASGWPALKKWTRPYLLQAFAGREVIVGNAPMRLAPYLAYHDANADEMPLYMFDKAFALAAPQLASDYGVPPHFADDLFAVLGEEARPDYRWLIIGPRGSGSSFHVDPNATSAWNTVVTGAKKWVLFPPGCVPPGVHVSADGADVAAPVSLMEWFLNYYDTARRGGDSSDSDVDASGGEDGAVAAANGHGTARACPRAVQGRGRRVAARRVRPLECIVRAGETIFVPSGWFHMVVNLEDSVAITQNFVSPIGVDTVLAYLRAGSSVPGLVSGCDHRADLYTRFLAALREHRPQVLEAHEARAAARRERALQDGRLGRIFREAAHGRQQQPQQQPQQVDPHQAPKAGGGTDGKAAAGSKGSAAATEQLPSQQQQQQQQQSSGFAFNFAF